MCRPLSGRPQHLLALAPVARAKFVGLQRIQHPQCFSGVTADIETIHRNMLDHIVRINIKSGAKGYALFGKKDGILSPTVSI